MESKRETGFIYGLVGIILDGYIHMILRSV